MADIRADPLEDSFAQMLTDFDEQLRTGHTITSAERAAPSVELQERLSAAQEFLRELAEIWPRTPDANPGPLHAPPRKIGRFEVQRILGSGGAGIVYLARDPLLGRDVAVKVPRLEMVLTASSRQRFQREGQAAALLNHPNVVPTLEVGQADDLCFIVYGYCDGLSLADWLARHPAPIPCLEIAHLVERLAEAMEHAHQRGIMHRDLKPANVLLQIADGADRLQAAIPLITDFGLAKLARDVEDCTRTGTLLGTPGYMAPEQTRGAKDLTPTCDLWALGVILYELLTRSRPFTGVTPVEVMRHIQENEPTPPRHLRREVPRDLETICLKCLAKEPAQRYASAFDLAADLRRFQEGRPVQARPVPWWERLSKWTRRRPAIAALCAVVTLALIGTVVGTFLYIGRLEELVASAQREKEAKERETHHAQQAARERALSRRLQYVGDVRSAVQAIKERNAGAARIMLDRWPGSTETDERGLEWFVLKRQVTLQKLTELLAPYELKPEDDRDTQIHDRRLFAMTPDGRHAVSMVPGGHLEIYETATWTKIGTLTPPPGERRFYHGLAFSADGKRLATVGNRAFGDGVYHPAVTLWDWHKRVPLATVDYPKTPELLHPADIAFSAGSDLLLVRVHQNLRVYAVADFPKEVAGFDTPPVNAFTLSTDGTVLALSTPQDKRVEVRAFPSLKLLHTILWDRPIERHHLLLSSDNRRLVFGGLNLLYLVDLQDPTPVLIDASNDSFTALAFSMDGKWLHMGTSAGHYDVYDTTTKSSVFSRSGLSITHLIPAPNGRNLFKRTHLGGVELSPANWPPDPEAIDTGAGRLYALAFSPGGTLLASGGQRPGVRVWDPASGKQVADLACASEVFALAFSTDGKMLAAGGIDGSIHRWDVATWKSLPNYTGHQGRVAGLAFTPDGKHLLSMSWDKTCRLWQLADGTTAHTFAGPYDYFSGLALAPDGSEFAWLGDNEATIRIWNLTHKTERSLPFVNRARAACYSNDGHWLAASEATGELFLWDTRANKLLRRIDAHTRGVRALAFAPDGKVLASAGIDKVVKLIDTTSFLELATLHGPRDELRALVWSPDGRTLAATGHDGHLWIWRANVSSP